MTMKYIPGTTSDEIIDDICNDIGNAALSKGMARLCLEALRERVRREARAEWRADRKALVIETWMRFAKHLGRGPTYAEVREIFAAARDRASKDTNVP